MAGAASLNALALPAPSPSQGTPVVRNGGGAFATTWTARSRFPSLRVARLVTVRASSAASGDLEDEWGKGPEPAADQESAALAAAAAAATAAAAVAEEPTAEAEAPAPANSEVAELKAKLKVALYGTERGMRASSETRAEVVELITQLEARNPTPAPTDALALLNGKWILAYTSFSQLFPLLGSGRLTELVKVEEISQTIDSENFTVQNCIKISGPWSTTSVSTNAKFEVRSPKRVQIKFDEGVISTPQLTDSIVLPEKFELFGQNIDLSPLRGIFSSIENAATSVAKTISGQPPLKIPIRSNNAESWLLTTYLDEELRISRGEGSSIFVLFKEGTTPLN